MTQKQHKILSTLIITAVSFFGFEILNYIIGLYQLRGSLFVAIYFYAFHIFWLFFLFDLHLKAKIDWQKSFVEGLRERFAHLKQWAYIRHFLNYLILPSILYWSAVILMFLNPFNYNLKHAIAFTTTAALSVAYYYMKEHISRKFEHDSNWLFVLAIVKLFAVFMSYSAAVALTFYMGMNTNFLFDMVLVATFLLLYQALFQHGLLNLEIILWVLGIALLMACCSLWVYHNWNTEYFAAALGLVAIYNMFWGLLHNYLDKTLDKKIALEYLAMMILILSLILASHNFSQKVI